MAPGDAIRAVRKINTTAAKIRALAAKGQSRADIARALGIRYQHVRNVLMRDEAKAKATESSDPTMMPGKVRIGSDGSAIVPAKVIDALALKEGDVLFVRIHDGEIHLLTKTAVMRRVQSLVREFVPEGVSLVDELLEDRRREVEAEAEDA
jgi:bifunctional DNA-binding transcriptional regulator/antitoxin component of YhaV-PrlF toxin-antitoxin module